MKHMKKFFLLFFVIVLTGVSSNIAYATTYPSSVAWNNFLYGLSVVEVDNKDIGDEIGKIKRERNPMPLKNGESNDKRYVGSSLFKIKGIDIEDAIAVKVEDKFFKATKDGPLQEQSTEQSWVATLSIIGILVLFSTLIIWIKKRRIS